MRSLFGAQVTFRTAPLINYSMAALDGDVETVVTFRGPGTIEGQSCFLLALQTLK